MSIEKMNELISKWERQKAEYVRKMDEKISAMKAQRDHDLLAQMLECLIKRAVFDYIEALEYIFSVVCHNTLQQCR